MELELSPVFYHQVAPTSPNTMRILPTAKGVQKVAIGDQDGILTCFGMKRGDCQIVFKTLPGPSISTLQLNGAPGSIPDRIFISAGTQVKAHTKKGKQFLKFESNLTEPIRSMWVDGNHLFTSGSYVYNHYIDCKDTDYFLSSDTINSVLSLPIERTSHNVMPVIACQDSALRVLKDSNLVYELEVAGPPSVLALEDGNGGDKGCGVLYGTQDGRLGLVRLHRDAPEYCWDMLNEHKYGGISSISCFDVNESGVPDILLGRNDGVVEVYSMDENNQPRIQFTHTFGESITNVQGGNVSSTSTPELLVSTYSGQMYGLTRGSSKKGDTFTMSSEVKAKIDSLKLEISQMESEVTHAHDQYYSMVKQGDDTKLSALPQFPINDQFSLNQDEAWYTLAIETQVPLDFVILQSNVPVDLQEVDKSSAVISYTQPDTENDNYLLATFRCSGATRLEVKVRSIEGQYGVLQAYVTPCLEPRSSCLRQYQIKPLSLHQRVHSFDDSLPCNILQMTGPFNLSDIHSWVSYCLPDVPDRPPEEDNVCLQFKSPFTNTQLQCIYSQGNIKFCSDNLSTISVLKEVVSKQATKKKIQVKITHDIKEDSIPHMLSLLHPRLEAQLMLAKNVQLIDALQELQIHEGDVSFLSPQCQYILENAELLQEEIKKQSAMIDRLYALITDLFMDRATFKGLNVKEKVPELLSLLDDCDLESLVEFFAAN